MHIFGNIICNICTHMCTSRNMQTCRFAVAFATNPLDAVKLSKRAFIESQLTIFESSPIELLISMLIIILPSIKHSPPNINESSLN